MLSPGEVEHIRGALAAAPMRDSPSPHIFAESVFSEALYQRLLGEFPSEDKAFVRWDHGGDPAIFFGNYDRRLEVNIPEGLQRLTESQRAFWSDMSDFLCGPVFAGMLISTFRATLHKRFGDELDRPSFFEQNMRGAMMLNKHDPGYYLGPHTDRFEKIVTCVFYMPERVGLDHLGTTLYDPKQPGFTCRGVVHHDPARFIKRDTIPFRANSAFIFARSDMLFHGVHRLTEADLHGSARPGFQMQFWEK